LAAANFVFEMDKIKVTNESSLHDMVLPSHNDVGLAAKMLGADRGN
jgi:hypothetical protein